ncbi:DegT/DnrJ/EryC1/StrS family aminotransferase [Agromyces mariniharenae]|uniref:DegT/DnrJ/EryC1/StrS family aminotransferase n=1 Tax=Agromyces mariniharenae TaxID=2604423 RepID=A0A5S4V5H7_9MICO|nr:DegT/DnrJ/EryC1/StrS family aminotransferase [Agromyces mariniharenae]TYL52511.1 DegT/DnrJ/EryC1/StrS family aminotransferase [Agromyces mariniharenae]
MIPITVVEFGEDAERLVLEVLRSGSVAQGPLVKQFEDRFAQMIGVKHAIAVNNGTTSLVAALSVLDLEPGDEVVTSPFTFVATLNAILEAGATARFADISEHDFNVTAENLAGAITDRTRVLMPVHLYGQIADMDGIAALAAERGLAIVEDSAQSHGSALAGRHAGTYGLGSFSFYATKNITTGEGGMITTDDDVLADRLRVLRNQGMRARYQYEVAGHNWRLTDLQAAVGLPQLGAYDTVVETRQSNAEYLSAGLAEVPGIVVPRQQRDRRHVWHQYTIRVTPESGISRDEFVSKLGERGVGAGIYYPKLVFDYPTYRDRDDVIIDEYPVAERIVQEVVSLPVHTHLTRDDLDRIISVVSSIVDEA